MTTIPPRIVTLTIPRDAIISRLVLMQPADSCAMNANEAQTIDMGVSDAGGGNYVVIKTDRWAANDTDIGALLAIIDALAKEPSLDH